MPDLRPIDTLKVRCCIVGGGPAGMMLGFLLARAQARALQLAWPVRLLRAWPFLRRIPARVLGLGFRPEHVLTRDVMRPGSAPR